MPTPTKGPRLGGGPAHEKLLIANLARALFSEGRIRTTEAKAKRLRPQAERLITFAKRGDVASRRQVLTVVRDKAVVHTLFAEIAPRFADRQGGYTRILKLGPRPGDAAPMVLIELVEQGDGERATGDTEDGAGRRRRFGRRRARAEAAPEGANRAERRAALRRRGPAPVEAEAALAGEDLDEDADELDELDEERPAVPTDAEIEAGATAAGDEDEDEDEAARPTTRTRPRSPASPRPASTRRRAEPPGRRRGRGRLRPGRRRRRRDRRRASTRTRTASSPPCLTGPGRLRRMRLVVAYDGGPFSGFARQRDRRTVQGELEAALARLAKRPVTTVGAGRTDAGVHARGQVVHADVPARLDPERVRRALNGGLGPAITVREAGWAPPTGSTPGSRPGGGPTCTASTTRATPTRCSAASCSPGPGPSTCPACARPPGPCWASTTSPPSAAAGPGRRPPRRLRSLGIRRLRGLVEVRLVADAFCWQMVRGIVGHLLLVGDGRRDPASTVAGPGRGRPLPRRQHRPTPRPGPGGRLLPSGQARASTDRRQ